MGPPQAECKAPSEASQSALCRREVSRCGSAAARPGRRRRSPQGRAREREPIRSRAPVSSRCRLAAMAAGLHPAISGVQVPPPRPLPGSSTVERPPVKRRDVGANPTPAASFARASFGERARGTAEALRSKASKTERTTTMIAVALVIAWLAVVGLVLIARVDYRRRPLIR